MIHPIATLSIEILLSGVLSCRSIPSRPVIYPPVIPSHPFRSHQSPTTHHINLPTLDRTKLLLEVPRPGGRLPIRTTVPCCAARPGGRGQLCGDTPTSPPGPPLIDTGSGGRALVRSASILWWCGGGRRGGERWCTWSYLSWGYFVVYLYSMSKNYGAESSNIPRCM